MDSKICRKCGGEKPLDKFGKQSSTKDGYKYYCKDCIAAINRSRYERDPERHKMIVRKWQEKNTEKVKGYKRNYLKRIRNVA